MLPKNIPEWLPGTVISQRVRCGKPNCRCAGGALHGPYYYRFWRDERGRLHKAYVKQADLETVRAACAARQQEEREIWETLAEGGAVVAWFLAGAERGSMEEDMRRIMEFPQWVGQLTKLAAGSHVRPGVSIRAFGILEPLWWHYRAQEEARMNMRLLFGERVRGAVPEGEGLDYVDR